MDTPHIISLSEISDLQNIRVVIAIPTFNEEHTISDVIETLAKEKAEIPHLSIVVADGRSSDRTVAIAHGLQERFPFLEVIENKKRLQSAAINLVARQWQDKADVLIRCDAHAHYPPYFVKRLIDTIVRTDAASVVVPMDSVGRNCVEKAVAWISDTPFGSGGSAHRGGQKSGFVDHGHHAAFNLRRFLENNGYDETFSHNEDAEFDSRLNASGHKVFLDADIRLQYHPRNSFSRLWRQYFNYGMGRSRTVRRHPQTVRMRQVVVPAHSVLVAFSIMAYILLGIFWPLIWPLTYLLALVIVSFSLAIKHRSICGLLGGLAATTMHFAWASGFFWGFIKVKENRWVPVEATA